jgi:hypothetical protein
VTEILSIDWDSYFPLADQLDGSCHACAWHSRCFPGKARRRLSRRPGVCVTRDSCLDHVVETLLGDPWEILQGAGIGIPALRGANVVVAECHADLPRVGNVTNFDRHDDFGAEHKLACGSWAHWGMVKGEIEHYQWIPQPEKPRRAKHWDRSAIIPAHPELLCYSGEFRSLVLPEKFDLIFVCLSKPYTPEIYDAVFGKFCLQLASFAGADLKVIGRGKRGIKRIFENLCFR